jgi:uncharacterized membrane protein
MTWGVVLAVHALCATIWVGGMFFALLVLRPSLVALEPAQRMALHALVFKRFFLVIWHAMPLQLISGYALLFGVYGGFSGAGPHIHVMHLAGLIMSGVFVVIFFGPWRHFRNDPAARPAAVEMIRKLTTVNLVLGLATIAVATIGF